MPRTVSANEAKNRLGALIGYVSDQCDEVIVENHGKPKAVIMSVAAYEEVKVLREQKRRSDALAQLATLRAEIGDRNVDLTDEEIEALSVRASREMIDDLAASGRIRFDRDRHLAAHG